MTFEDFVEEVPGLAAYAISVYLMIDVQAQHLGAEIIATRDIRVMRNRASDPTNPPCLRAQNQQMIDALERDPTGRLAAVPSLLAWAQKPNGVGRHWIRWYVTIVIAWIDAQKAPNTVPMQAEHPILEMVP